MTNEEAIVQLMYIKDFKTPQQIEALDMAIKALEEQDDAGYEQGWADGYAYGIGGENEP